MASKRESLFENLRSGQEIMHGRRVPKQGDRFLSQIVLSGDWKHSPDGGPSWLPIAEEIAKLHRVDLIYDPRRDWSESLYYYYEKADDKNNAGKKTDAEESKRGCIAVGGKGGANYSCTVFLHELGHHILFLRGQMSTDPIKNEEEAWRIAHKIANEYGLPCLAEVRRKGLSGYKLEANTVEVVGSKRKRRRRPEPKSIQLGNSRRSAEVSEVAGGPVNRFLGSEKRPLGKKGKRFVKKHIKQATAKAERKAGKKIDEQ